MAATDPTTLVANAACIECGIPHGMQWAVLISVFARMANMNTDPASLISGAACIECGIPNGMQLPVLIYLAGQILNNGGGVFSGNYGGAAPNFTPTTSGAVARDTGTGQVWWWDGTQWN